MTEDEARSRCEQGRAAKDALERVERCRMMLDVVETGTWMHDKVLFRSEIVVSYRIPSVVSGFVPGERFLIGDASSEEEFDNQIRSALIGLMQRRLAAAEAALAAL